MLMHKLNAVNQHSSIDPIPKLPVGHYPVKQKHLKILTVLGLSALASGHRLICKYPDGNEEEVTRLVPVRLVRSSTSLSPVNHIKR